MVTLAEELPFAAVVEDEHLEIRCSACFASKEARTLSKCTRCHVVHYCNKVCQQKDWANHKYECSFMRNCSPMMPSSLFRLIARIAIKLKTTKTSDPAFNGRVYEELMDHRDEIHNDLERMELFYVVSDVLHEYMGKKFVPDSTVLMSIFGKVTTNYFAITDDRCDSIGHGLYIGLSVHNHSCSPDAFIHFDGIKAVLRSPDIDMKYSKDLNITYIDLLETNQDRKQKLQSSYYFTCTCKLCSDDSREFLYNSGRAVCCPDSYCLLDPNANKMTCFKCGTISKISVSDAITANEQIRIFCESYEESESNSDLARLINAYEHFSMILSPFNINLFLLNDIVVHHTKSRNLRVSNKYAEHLLPAYRRYLTVGSPVLTAHLMYNAVSQSIENPLNDALLPLFEEAYTASLVSHGPGHPVPAFIERKHSASRILLHKLKRKENFFFYSLISCLIICLIWSVVY